MAPASLKSPSKFPVSKPRKSWKAAKRRAVLIPRTREAALKVGVLFAHHYRPGQYSGGPSWLTFLGHMKERLWSMDLIQVRVGHVADPLDPGRHGSIFAPDYWVRRPCWDGRWWRTLSDVQPRHSGPTQDAKVPKPRQRSALSGYTGSRAIRTEPNCGRVADDSPRTLSPTPFLASGGHLYGFQALHLSLPHWDLLRIRLSLHTSIVAVRMAFLAQPLNSTVRRGMHGIHRK
jgi:hypothetical protein